MHLWGGQTCLHVCGSQRLSSQLAPLQMKGNLLFSPALSCSLFFSLLLSSLIKASLVIVASNSVPSLSLGCPYTLASCCLPACLLPVGPACPLQRPRPAPLFNSSTPYNSLIDSSSRSLTLCLPLFSLLASLQRTVTVRAISMDST